MIAWYRRLWNGDDSNERALRAVSLALMPAEWLYRMVIGLRTVAYDRSWMRSESGSIPTLAIGNLTVGGTGKTPVSAWFASALRERGSRPAVVMRGYGADEIEVHQHLNPMLPVFASPDRVAGVLWAHQEGADAVVLDDAFQHRSLRADGYVVLIAAEEWTDHPRLLPRGPWREPLAALGRATLIAVTRKSESAAGAARVVARLSQRHPNIPVAQLELRLRGLSVFDAASGLGTTENANGFRCAVAVAGVARPQAVWFQLEASGVKIDSRKAFPDHHRYSQQDIEEIVRLARGGPVVATLKDAVKLSPALGERVELLVPIQEVVWESGMDDVTDLLARIDARRKAEA